MYTPASAHVSRVIMPRGAVDCKGTWVSARPNDRARRSALPTTQQHAQATEGEQEKGRGFGSEREGVSMTIWVVSHPWPT